ncbi:MAG: FKBP-type peptidyl-prolyl cis-trans isomerase [Flavobacteriales bacterium]|nr:FKBP-type peptidyl-prolyl cis-trans isomerase [Flavobacteriales bacterium]
MSSRNILPTLLIALLAACSRSPYEGYKSVGQEAHLRYIILGEGERVPQDDDSLLIRFRASDLNGEAGSLWSTERWYRSGDLREGALRPILRRLHTGDSMSVIAPASQWPWPALLRTDLAPPHDTITVRMELLLLDLLTPAAGDERRARFKADDPEGFERMLIDAYTAQDSGAWMRWGTSDLHYRISGAPLDTARWDFGDPLRVRWEGFCLADGRALDATSRNGGDFAWAYGTPDQLLQGLEVAVSLLREGQQGEFIFPSRMAFGDRGLAGALEPGMPVRYAVSVARDSAL